jgi:hypothetical protein
MVDVDMSMVPNRAMALVVNSAGMGSPICVAMHCTDRIRHEAGHSR